MDGALGCVKLADVKWAEADARRRLTWRSHKNNIVPSSQPTPDVRSAEADATLAQLTHPHSIVKWADGWRRPSDTCRLTLRYYVTIIWDRQLTRGRRVSWRFDVGFGSFDVGRRPTWRSAVRDSCDLRFQKIPKQPPPEIYFFRIRNLDLNFRDEA